MGRAGLVVWWCVVGVSSGTQSLNGTSLFQIEIPYSLYRSGGYRHKEAMFGAPKYGVTLTERLFYADSILCDETEAATLSWETPFLLMVDRGDCTFVKKARNAQKIGASGIIVADNRCYCADMACIPEADDTMGCENQEPIMADDGSGSDITIPAILLWKSDADAIKAYFQSEANAVVQAKLEWSIPHPDNRVEWELWATSVDESSMAFLRDFRSTVLALGTQQYFTPHFYTWNGTAYGCPGTSRCGSLCTNNGRYCAPDPDGKADAGLSGADVVAENLRRTCVWKYYGGLAATDQADRGVGPVWWDYLSSFSDKCDTAELFADASCVDQALAAAGADADLIQRCMDDSGGLVDGPNTILEHELVQLATKNIYVVPECIINGQSVWGALTTANVLETICHGYSSGDEPEACDCLTFAANANDAAYTECLDGISAHKSSSSKSKPASGYMPWWGVLFLVLTIIVVMLVAALVYWKKTQQQMRDQVRGILAEYMPLEDVGPTSNNNLGVSNPIPGLSIQA